MTFLLFVDWVAVGGLGGLVWAMACNFRTAAHRHALIVFIFAQPDWWVLRRHLHTVSYERHLWFLLTFRDPRRLYSAAVEGAWK